MKRLFLIITLLTALVRPSLAHAQFPHASFFNGGTTLTATCTNLAAATTTSSDSFLGTAQGNTTVTLPASAIGCHDYDVIDLRFTQAASHSYTLTVNAGTGTATKIISNSGSILAAPTGAASGAANELHQIWVYNAVATTPQWELVTQTTVPAVTSLGVNGNPDGTAGDLRAFKTAGDAQPYMLCGAGVGVAGSNGCIFGVGGSTAPNTNAAVTYDGTNLYLGDFLIVALGSGNVFVANSANNQLTAGHIIATAQISATSGAVISSTGGTAPTVTCSGGSTGTSVTAGSTNNRGSIVSSSSASTNCTITWSAASAWNQAPFCQFTDGNASVTPVAYSTGACGTSTCVVDFVSATSKTIVYMCM